MAFAGFSALPHAGGRSHAPVSTPVAPRSTTAVFEANGGRTDPRVAFVAHRDGSTLFVTRRGPVLSLSDGKRRAVLATTFRGARGGAPSGTARLPGVVNSFVGARSSWRTGIPTFGRVVQRGLYPGVDLVYHGERGPFEYDFAVAPGASTDAIAVGFRGARHVSVAKNGDLVIDTPGGRLTQPRPVASQDGREVAVSYVVDRGSVKFRLGAYDKSRPLLIDPELAYSRFLAGGNDFDTANAIAVDSSGNTYIAGNTDSTDFPTASAFDSTKSTLSDAFVIKLSADGATRLYSTYIGGTGDDRGQGIAVDSSGRAIVSGYTGSTSASFPTATGLGPIGTGLTTDIFFMRLSASGTSVDKVTRIGGTGSDYGYGGVALSSTGTKVYVAGSTASPTGPTTAYPSTNGKQTSFGGNEDAVLSVVDISGVPTMSYSTYLGGAGFDRAYGVAVDPSGNAYIAGSADSAMSFGAPTWSDGETPGGSASQGRDAFISKFNPGASGNASLVYSSNFGGSGTDMADGVGVNSAGEAYIFGTTDTNDASNCSTGNTCTFPVAFALPSHGTYAGGTDAFFAKVRADGQALLMSTFLGGSGNEETLNNGSIAVDSQGNAIVSGTTTSSGGSTNATFPIVRAVQEDNNGDDAFVTKIKTTSGQIVFSTFYGGTGGESPAKLAVDAQGGIYLAGSTGSTGPPFPIVGPSADPTLNGDTFAAKIQSPRAGSIDSGPSGPIGTSSAAFTFSLPATETQTTFQCRVDAAPFAACTSPYSTGALADGAHTAQVRPLDFGGTPGPAASRAFAVDTTGPTAPELQAPAEGDTTGALPAFSWSASSDPGTGVAGYTVMIDGAANGQADGACSPCSATPTTPIPDGPHTWRIDARDAAGNVTQSPARSFSVSQAPAAAFTAAPNPALVGRVVTFDGSGSSDNSKVTRWEWDLDGDGSFETDTGAVPTTTRSYPAKATVKVGLRVSDAAGQTGTTTRPITINAAPKGQVEFGVSVNKGAQFTNDPDVRLELEFPLSTTSVLVSNDGGFKNAKSFLPAPDLPWKLESSGPERLPKTVYVRFLPNLIAGLTFTDDIILDQTPPQVVAATLAPATTSSASSARAAAARKWTVKVKATDKTSGVASVQVTTNKRKPGKLVRYKKKLTVKSATRPKFIRARDRAKNYSRWRKLR